MSWTQPSKPIPPAEFRPYQPTRIVGYFVSADTACVVKRKGDSHWRQFRTSEDCTFDKGCKGENGYTFERDGWLIHIPACSVTVLTETGTRPR